MLCREFLQNLSLYVDDALTLEARALCDEHVRVCPVCRDELLELQALTASLREFKKPYVPVNLAESLRSAVAIELAAQREIARPTITIPFWQKIWEQFVKPQMLPYATGAVASILLFSMMFASLRSSVLAFRGMEIEARRERLERERLMAAIDNTPYENRQTLPAADYAVRRLTVAAESPSLDPNSPFVALASSLAKGATKNDAILVVADVFSSGIANVANVLEPPREADKLAELEKLLRDEPAFVPAALDRRPDNVRVVLLIQEVEVPTIDRVEVRSSSSSGTNKMASNNAKFRFRNAKFVR